MLKPGKALKKDTLYIAFFVFVLSVFTEAVFLVLNKWNLDVLWGNLLSGTFAVFNFFLMGIGVEKAVTKDEKEAKNIIKTSQTLRQFMLFAVAGVGAYFFNWITAVLPLFFPRIAITIKPFLGKNK